MSDPKNQRERNYLLGRDFFPGEFDPDRAEEQYNTLLHEYFSVEDLALRHLEKVKELSPKREPDRPTAEEGGGL